VRQNAGETMSRELLLKGGLVVTVDDALEAVPDGDVLIRDGAIVAVDPGLSTSNADAEVIDCKGRLVIPGLVDTHRHVWQGAIGAFTPQMTGVGYDPAVLNGISTRYEPEDIYAGTLWGALQALDAGFTTIADWAHDLRSAAHADANLHGLQESQIRGYFLYGGHLRSETMRTSGSRGNLGSRFQRTSAWREHRMRSSCSTGSAWWVPT
jgi:5-methylthioadenosine/S-adenosylhomocysteine deaminase